MIYKYHRWAIPKYYYALLNEIWFKFKYRNEIAHEGDYNIFLKDKSFYVKSSMVYVDNSWLDNCYDEKFIFYRSGGI